MKNHQIKGIIISILFVLVVAFIGIDIGRMFWIALVLFFAATGIYYTAWAVVRAIRGRRAKD